jgi:polyhydroxybutyrate depolymerase
VKTRTALLAALIAALVNACGSAAPASDPAHDTTTAAPTQPGGSPASPPSSTPSTPAGPSGTCTATTFGAGLTARTLTVGGVARRYQILAPDSKTPLPVVFVFHGLGGDGDQIRAYLDLEPFAKGAAIFVYPDGLPRAAEGGGATAWALDDIDFFDAMLAEIEGGACVDKARIFATGHSYGAYMSNLVGCERGDVVRAIAPVSGGFVAQTCKGHVAAWLAHGTSDDVVAFSEGEAARDHWLAADGCTATTAPTTPSPCVRYEGCAAGYPVEWCPFAGTHYPLPAFTAEAIWSFFSTL